MIKLLQILLIELRLERIRGVLTLALTFFITSSPIANSQTSASNPFNNTTITNAFKQGKHYNNCSSIALIKAAIGTFGLEKVFKQVLRQNDSVVFKLRNGEQIAITPAEISYCTLNNGFILKSTDTAAIKIKNFADTCFAVMCKKEQLLDSSTFEAAVERLNIGYKTSEISVLLGVKFKSIQPLNLKNLSRYEHIIIYNYYHAAYATNGIYDEPLNKTGLEKIGKFPSNHLGKDYEYIPYLCEIREGYDLIDF